MISFLYTPFSFDFSTIKRNNDSNKILKKGVEFIMIKAMTAQTFEIDDSIIATNEILEQLDLENNLLKNAIGYLSCHSDFIEEGTVKELCNKLPFDVIGCTTHMSANNYGAGDYALTLIVLTSNDVEFSSGLSDPLNFQEPETATEQLYQKMTSAFNKEVKLMMIAHPSVPGMILAKITETLGKISNQTPVFGTLAVDIMMNDSPTYVVFNGESYEDRITMIMISGNIQPRFFIESFSSDMKLSQGGMITESKGTNIVKINNAPAKKYLEKIGLVDEGNSKEIIQSIPLAIDYKDGTTPQVTSLYGLTDDGAVITGNEFPPGGIIVAGSLINEDVLKTTSNLIHDILKQENKNALFLFSCISRNAVLNHPMAEIDTIKKLLATSNIPYLFAYSGGEICPLYTTVEKQKTVNRYHSYSIIACLI